MNDYTAAALRSELRGSSNADEANVDISLRIDRSWIKMERRINSDLEDVTIP